MPSNRSRRADRARRRLGVLLSGTPDPAPLLDHPGGSSGSAGSASSGAYVIADTSTSDDEPVRWVPTHLRGLALLFAVALLLAGGWWVLSRPRGAPVVVTSTLPADATPLVSPSASGSAPITATASPAAASQVVVDVEGKVRRPGIVRLPAGSRVIDALRAAGVRAGVATSTLNLARVLVDGEQLWVGPPPSGAGVAPPSTSTGGTAASGPVNLNTATLEQLDTLPGIGMVLAQRILDWRAAHGNFTSIDQLTDVSGIGDATFTV